MIFSIGILVDDAIVLDRKTGNWLWVDFEDEQYGGYSIGDFEVLVREHDFLSLVDALVC